MIVPHFLALALTGLLLILIIRDSEIRALQRARHTNNVFVQWGASQRADQARHRLRRLLKFRGSTGSRKRSESCAEPAKNSPHS